METAWLAQPHPDLADAYAHVKLGDSARQRLVRVETLAAKAPGHLESALAVARAAIDASEFARAREALAPFIAAPTQRVAMLMAEIERTEHGDSGRARAWTLRAVRALHDPVWTADGYVSRQMAAGVAGLGPARCVPVADPGRGVAVGQGRRARRQGIQRSHPVGAAPRRVRRARSPVEDAQTPAAQDNSPANPSSSKPPPSPRPRLPPRRRRRRSQAAPRRRAESAPMTAAPLFRARTDLGKARPAPIPAIIPIVRAPDDPGIDDEPPPRDEFAEQLSPSQGQAGGWRGFLSRLGG